MSPLSHSQSASILFLTFLTISQTQRVQGLFEYLVSNRSQSHSSSSLHPRPHIAPIIQSRQVSLTVTPESSYNLQNSHPQHSQVVQFGEECETNGKHCDASRFLECIDGKCLCKNPMTRAYDEDEKQCVSLSGSPCGTGKPPCVKKSQCKFGACQCDQNHSETTSKICLKNRFMGCRPRECNMDLGLACMKGICQCIDDSMVFDPFSNKCVNPQVQFDKFAKSLSRTVASRVVSGTVRGATSLVFLPLRLIPVIG